MMSTPNFAALQLAKEHLTAQIAKRPAPKKPRLVTVGAGPAAGRSPD